MFPGKFESLSQFYAGVATFPVPFKPRVNFLGFGNILCIITEITNDLL